MMEWGRRFREAAAVLLGAAAYTVLSWVPIAGPFISGAIVGYGVSGGFKRGMRWAALSAGMGCGALAYLILSTGILAWGGNQIVLSAFIGWVLIVYSAFGVLFASLGGGIAAADIGSIFRFGFPKGDERPRPDEIEYVLCPSCGHGRKASAKACDSCGGQR